MGKKKPGTNPDDSKARVELRMDPELHQLLTQTAQEVGCSLNQLVQGICWGAVAKMQQGDLEREPDGFVRFVERKGALAFGIAGNWSRKQIRKVAGERIVARDMPTSQEEYERAVEEEVVQIERNREPQFNGERWFVLDFTERGVVR